MSEKFKLAFGDANELSAAIREAIGVGPYDEVECVTPQFTRTNGRKVTYFPSSPNQFDALKDMRPEVLKELCLGLWDEGGPWLLPGEWYDFIPEGYPLYCISGEIKPFKKGVTDNDIRFGCLAYGIMLNKPVAT